MRNSIPPDTGEVIDRLLAATNTAAVESVLSCLPIVDPQDYTWSRADPEKGWRDGLLHWVPVGRDRGNAGRIKLAEEPVNPLAERLINGMEAIIELERLRELQRNPEAPIPSSPRDAVQRYFGLPRIDSIPGTPDNKQRRRFEEQLRRIRARLRLRLRYDKQSREFAVSVEDDGLGQPPSRIHETLLSLGQTDKADKPYLIGVFGQGGSSAFAASKYSIVVSRRAPDICNHHDDGIAWSVVTQVFPKQRRDPYFAYLVASPSGEVPALPPEKAPPSAPEHGTVFVHFGYDFGRTGSAVARTLYQSLNHVLFNPILPYELFALKDDADPMYGTAQRLARQTTLLRNAGETSTLDKSFAPQPVGEHEQEGI